MAEPTTTSGVGTRLDALRVEVAELTTGCRKHTTLTGSAAAQAAASELGHQFALIRKSLDKANLVQLRDRLG